MSEYFDLPDPSVVDEPTRDLAERLARSAAAAVQVYGHDHIGVWGESAQKFPAGMLETIHRHDGKIIYAGVKPLPGDHDNTTWRKHSAEPGVRRGWVEVRLPHAEVPDDV